MALMKDLFYADLMEIQWKEKLMSYIPSDFCVCVCCVEEQL